MQTNTTTAVDALDEIAAIAVPIERVPNLTGLARSRIFEAVKAKRLTVRKDGKASIVEMDELRRYVRSLPTRGRAPEPEATAA